jgi:hypothetical protein
MTAPLMQETAFGSMNYNVLAYILKTHGIIRQGYGAEIGVLYGDTSRHLLAELPNLTLFSIDPYLPYDEPNRTSNEMSRYEQEARAKLAPFGQRSKMLKTTSVVAAQQIPDGLLDFVFIDALHTYEAVKEDMASWYPKVRAGGLFAGHDWSWQGVRQAVTEFSQERSLSGFNTPLASDIWMFFKP